MFTSKPFFLSLLLIQFAGAPARSQSDVVRDGDANRVTIQEIGQPLALILPKLAAKGEVLSLGREFTDVKATVVVHNEPRAAVIARIAELFGAEWRSVPESNPTQWELRRTKPVTEWIKAYHAAKAAAEKEVRDLQEDQIRRSMKQALAELDGPPRFDENGNLELPNGIGSLELARFLTLMTSSDLDAIVRYMADISPLRDGGDAESKPSPIVRPFQTFTREQQQLLRKWVARSAPDGSPVLTARLGSLNDAIVEIGSREAAGIDFKLHFPSGSAVDDYAVSGAYGGRGMEIHLRQGLLKRLSQRDTPAGTLLGAKITGGGEVISITGVTNAVKPQALLDDIGLRRKRIDLPALLPGHSQHPKAPDFLAAVAAACNLNLIADYHTSSARFQGLPFNTAERLVSDAAQDFEFVIHQQNNYLFARHLFWPDRDEEETPYPHPEHWIAAKEAKRSLNLDDLALLSHLSTAQLDKLAAYRDGNVRFDQEVRAARRYRWVWNLAGELSSRQRKQAESEDGLPVASLDLPRRTFLVRSVGIQAPWEQVRLRIFHYGNPKSGFDDKFEAQLFLPNSSVPLWRTQ